MKFLRCFVTGLFLLASMQVNASPRELTMGIFPYASTSQLVSHHKNIKKHINKSDTVHLSLVTATDVPTYLNNLKNFKYDLIYSAPHIARFVEKKYGYIRVAMTTHQIRGVLLTGKNSSIHSIDDLKGKKLSMASPKTILHQIMLKQLNANNIHPGKDINLRVVNTHNNAIFDVINGESDAAITGIKLWKKLPSRHKQGLRQVSLTDPTTGFIILAKPGTNPSTVNTLKESFLTFNTTLAGKTYIFKGFKTITDEAMESLDFHAKVFE